MTELERSTLQNRYDMTATERRVCWILASVVVSFDVVWAVFGDRLFNCFAVMIGCSNVLLVTAGFGLLAVRQQRKQLRTAMQETIVTERVVASHAAGELHSEAQVWTVFDIGEGLYFSADENGLTPGNWGRDHLCGVFREITTTSGYAITTESYGRSRFRRRRLPTLETLIPDTSARRDVIAALDARPLVVGRFETLAADLLAHVSADPTEVLTPVPPHWDALQAAVEDTFEVTFGVGALAKSVSADTPPTSELLAERLHSYLPRPAGEAVAPSDRRAMLATVRRGLIRALNVDEAAVRPTTRLDALFPARNRWRAWQRFQRQPGLYGLPRVPTDPPESTGCIVFCVVVATIVVVMVVWLEWISSVRSLHSGAGGVAYTAFLLSLIVGIGMLTHRVLVWQQVLRRPFAFPFGVETVNDLVGVLAPRRAAEAYEDDGNDPAVGAEGADPAEVRNVPTVAAIADVLRERWLLLPDRAVRFNRDEDDGTEDE